MNRYQFEVAEMDRRHQSKVRALSFFGAAALIVLALWSAGLPPTEWIDRVQAWMGSITEQNPQLDTQSKPDATRIVATPTSVPVPSPAMPQHLPGTDASTSEVPLPLLLVATAPGRSAFEGTANIGTDARNPQTYAAGALLLNGARLTEIHKTYVVLQRDEKNVRLYLQGQAGAANGADELLAVGGDSKRTKPIAVSHEVITDYIRPSPLFDGEQIRGYEVYAGRDAGLFAQLGLRSGDVIVSLNDMPFSDPMQAMDLFRQLMSGTAMVATVERSGKRERITLDGALIAADQERKQQAQASPQLASMPLPPS